MCRRMVSVVTADFSARCEIVPSSHLDVLGRRAGSDTMPRSLTLREPRGQDEHQHAGDGRRWLHPGHVADDRHLRDQPGQDDETGGEGRKPGDSPRCKYRDRGNEE